MRVRAAAKAIIMHEGKFLLVKGHVTDDLWFWDVPGGHVEYGESPEEALLREVMEEVGLQVTIDAPLGAWWFIRSLDKDQVVCTTYRCTPAHTEIVLDQNPASDDIREYVWVTKEEFLKNDYLVSHASLKQCIAANL